MRGGCNVHGMERERARMEREVDRLPIDGEYKGEAS